MRDCFDGEFGNDHRPGPAKCITTARECVFFPFKWASYSILQDFFCRREGKNLEEKKERKMR